jgi:hypothetical protein
LYIFNHYGRILYKEVIYMSKLKPGDPAPKPGTYEIVGPHGGNTGHAVHITHPGHPMPPTPKPNETFKKK